MPQRLNSNETLEERLDRLEGKIDTANESIAKLIARQPAPAQPDVPPVKTGVKVPPARDTTQVTTADTNTLTAALTASFAEKYPGVGSHAVPGREALAQTLAFFPADVAAAKAQAWAEEAAALRGNDQLAFGGPTNHDTGDFLWYALQAGQPLSDFYGENSPVPFDPNFKPKNCGQGWKWDPVSSRCIPIEGFFNNVGSLIVPK